MCLQISHNPR